MRKTRLAAVPVTAVCLSLVLLPSALGSAAPALPILLIRSPFTSHGGLNETGNLTTVNKVPYAGGSTILAPPTFNLTSGRVESNQSTYSQQGGMSGLETWAGVQNLTFKCRSSCASGVRELELLWNLSWIAGADTNCSYYYSAGTWAKANVVVVGSIYDVSGSGHALVGTTHATPFKVVMAAPTYRTAVSGTKLVRLSMILSLKTGVSYEIETQVFLTTWAHSRSGCIDGTWASIGAPSSPGSSSRYSASRLILVKLS